MIRKYKRAYVRQALAELLQHYRAYQKATAFPKTLRQWLKLDPE